MKTYTENDIREYIESHDENVPTPEADLRAMFAAIYDRAPEEDEEIDMWSHICAGVSHS